MAKFTAFVSTDISDGLFDYGAIGELTHSTTNLGITDYETWVVNFPGTYNLLFNTVVSGTVLGGEARELPGGALLAKLEEINIDVITFAPFLNNRDEVGLMNLVLSGNDTLIGSAFNDRLLGLGGNDTINGNGGKDTMIGGAGNDTYVVNTARDVVTELTGQGTDQINSSVSRTLGAHQENLLLTGQGAIRGTGNTLANRLTGNTAGNILTGFGGADSLIGGGGKDSLNGANNATFGKDEIDALEGGTGSDVFILGIAGGCLFNDGNAARPGLTDYALITDFTPGQLDKLQLKGSADQYLLGASPLAGVIGRALYLDSNLNGTLQAGTDELIAIINSPVVLSAANTIHNADFV